MKISEMPGCGPVIEKKLAKHDIIDVQQLITMPPPQVAARTGLDNDSCIELHKKAKAFINKKKGIKSIFETGPELDTGIDTFITTGTKALDKLLNGGLRLGACTEFYGEDGCGKTQFSHVMAVRVQLPVEKGGLNGKCVWIDTENTFKKDRIIQIAQSLDLSPAECFENIIVTKPHNSSDQQTALEEVEKLIINDDTIKLIIVDSAMGLFRGDYLGRAMLSERQKYLNKFLTLSHNISKFYNIATIWTNQVSTNPGVFYGDPMNPIGGKIMGHHSTYRVYFKVSGMKRIGTLMKSPSDDKIQVTFGVTGIGMVDPEVIDEIIKEKKKAKKKDEDEE